MSSFCHLSHFIQFLNCLGMLVNMKIPAKPEGIRARIILIGSEKGVLNKRAIAKGEKITAFKSCSKVSPKIIFSLYSSSCGISYDMSGKVLNAEIVLWGLWMMLL